MGGLDLTQPLDVALEPASTALLVLDMTDVICLKRPSCVASIPAIADLLTRAREAGVAVIHTMGASGSSTFVEALAPLHGEPVMRARADKFHDTDLAGHLEARGARRVVACGTSANGAVLYTAHAASIRGYAVVVPTDGVSADLPEVLRFSLWQLLHQPGSANPGNDLLPEGRVTLSTIKGITFVPA